MKNKYAVYSLVVPGDNAMRKHGVLYPTPIAHENESALVYTIAKEHTTQTKEITVIVDTHTGVIVEAFFAGRE